MAPGVLLKAAVRTREGGRLDWDPAATVALPDLHAFEHHRRSSCDKEATISAALMQ